MIGDFEKYAHAVLTAKGIQTDNIMRAEITKALLESYGLTYHAVALDVEGTIKVGSEENIPENILKLIEKIITSGAYILFVTGSGSSTVLKILHQIKNVLPRSSPSYRKIYAIDGNGCRLFFLDSHGRIHYKQITERIKEKIGEKNYQRLLRDLNHKVGNYFEIQEKYCGIRLVSKKSMASKELDEIVSSWYKERAEQCNRIGIRIVSGSWSDKRTYDISHTDKDYALTWFYTEYDFIDVPILRIGDQGKENGNDFTFLDSLHGFSVGSLSSNPTKCFPVYDFQKQEILKGIEGASYILGKIKFSSRLTLPSSLISEISNEYYNACWKLRIEAEKKHHDAFDAWSESASIIFPHEFIDSCRRTNFANIYDHKSGAIKFSDKDWSSLNLDCAVLVDFFKKRDSESCDYANPCLIRSLYTDTGVILRGSKYYIGLSEEPSFKQAQTLIKENAEILEIARKSDPIQLISESTNTKYQTTIWKLNLALLDNFRNNSLLLYNMLFQAATLPTSSRPYWKRLLQQFEPYVQASINLYYSLFLVNHKRYRSMRYELNKSTDAFFKLYHNIELLYTFLESNGVEKDKIIRKWREVDHPGQIFVVLNSIESDISELLKGGRKVCALGLMYGGIELPFALKSCYNKEGIENLKIAELMGISFYGQEGTSSIMEQYSRDVLKSAMPNVERLEEIIEQGDTAIIFDDNIMTGRSIELAADRLIAYGVNVPFSVCVRFPPEHRIHQMRMRRHGGVNPGVLGTEIKGLITQSPYSRIFTSDDGYKDTLGVFDLSRQRILKYLRKNGLTIREDL